MFREVSLFVNYLSMNYLFNFEEAFEETKFLIFISYYFCRFQVINGIICRRQYSIKLFDFMISQFNMNKYLRNAIWNYKIYFKNKE